MSMMNNLREFVDKKLQGVVTWQEHCRMLNDGSRDIASIEINPPLHKGKAERYRVSCQSSYQVPPLGRVELMQIDSQGIERTIEGPNGDATWSRIAAYIKGNGGVQIPEEKSQAFVAHAQVETIPLDGRSPSLALPVVYHTNPGEAVAGMMELAAFVTRVHSPLVVDLVIFPPASDPFHRENVPRCHDGNSACRWDFHDQMPYSQMVAQPVTPTSQQAVQMPESRPSSDASCSRLIQEGRNEASPSASRRGRPPNPK